MPLLALRDVRRALLRVGILSLFYFCHGVSQAWSSAGERWLAIVEIVLLTVLLIAALTVLLTAALGAGGEAAAAGFAANARLSGGVTATRHLDSKCPLAPVIPPSSFRRRPESHFRNAHLPLSSFRRRPEELFNSEAGHRTSAMQRSIVSAMDSGPRPTCNGALRRSSAIPAFAGMTMGKVSKPWNRKP